MPKTVLFVGGGTIGHIAPSIAVWKALQKLDTDLQAHFVCSPRGEDASFLEKEGYNYTVTDAPRLSLTFPFKFIRAYKHAKEIVDRIQPQVVFCKGGYVSVPLSLAAKMRGIPIVLHESDAKGGHANQVVSRWASHICLGFPPKNESPHRTFTGNPVREEIAKGKKEEGLRITGFSGNRPILLVMGGTQGAQAINEMISKKLHTLLPLCDIVHITGTGKSVIHQKTKGYWSVPFAFQELPHLYACATLALSRAGAGSLAELAANGVPTILVPLRGVGHDHQQKNAVQAAMSKGCVVMQQVQLDAQLVPFLKTLLGDTRQLQNMSESIRKLFKSDADRQIAQIILQYLALSKEGL